MVNFEDVKEIMKKNKIIENNISNIIGSLSLKEAGLDSLDFMMLIHEINSKYNIDMMDTNVKLTKENNFDDLVNLINLKTA